MGRGKSITHVEIVANLLLVDTITCYQIYLVILSYNNPEHSRYLVVSFLQLTPLTDELWGVFSEFIIETKL